MLLGAKAGAWLAAAAGLLGSEVGAMKETDAGRGREAEDGRAACEAAGKVLLLLLRLCRRCRGPAAAADWEAD